MPPIVPPCPTAYYQDPQYLDLSLQSRAIVDLLLLRDGKPKRGHEALIDAHLSWERTVVHHDRTPTLQRKSIVFGLRGRKTVTSTGKAALQGYNLKADFPQSSQFKDSDISELMGDALPKG